MSNHTAARRRLIRRLLTDGRVASQHQLVELLSGSGHHVAQATVSRDLGSIGAIRVRDASGATHYEIDDAERFATGEPDGRLASSIEQFVESIAHSRNIVVVHTAPGAAQFVASGIDGAGVEGVVGTVAGDDTIMIVADAAVGGAEVQRRLERMGAG